MRTVCYLWHWLVPQIHLNLRHRCWISGFLGSSGFRLLFLSDRLSLLALIGGLGRFGSDSIFSWFPINIWTVGWRRWFVRTRFLLFFLTTSWISSLSLCALPDRFLLCSLICGDCEISWALIELLSDRLDVALISFTSKNTIKVSDKNLLRRNRQDKCIIALLYENLLHLLFFFHQFSSLVDGELFVWL